MFQIENDMENYVKFKLMGGNLQLKKSAAPHKFSCQKELIEYTDLTWLKRNAKKQLSNHETIDYRLVIL